MNRYSLTHVPDSALLHDLRSLLARERATTAELLAHLAEVDARKLYAPAGYPSMFAYCVDALRLSEEAAFKRIRAARVARQYPAVFALVADGRLHLSAVVMLAAYLTPENAEGLLAAAAHQSKAGIEQLLAERFPRPDLPDRIEGLGLSPAVEPSAPGRMGFADAQSSLKPVGVLDGQLSPGTVGATGAQLSPGTVGPSARSGVAPLAPGRYALQFTVAQGTYEKLSYAQALLGHAVPSADLVEVFDRALDALIGQLERRKFAATSRPSPRQKRPSANPRHVPAEVRRAVWERDGGRCTFVSATGHRCEARSRLEFDHVEPVARGGQPTVKGIRLRCRAHNQYAAECAFGTGFMSRKREAARRASGAARGRAAATEEARALAAAAAEEARALAAAAAEDARVRAAAAAEEARARAAAVEEVVPWLRALGLRLDEARRAAARCEAIPDATLEARLRCALSGFARPARRCAAPAPQPMP
jgi:hypothetical protein